jgi:hypothetical protein
MSLVCIRATFECDGCGTQFRIEMSPSAMRPKGWSLMEEAEDFLRGMCAADGGMPAMVHDLHLCDECHGIAAKVGGLDDDAYAPKEQIQAAIAQHYDAMNRVNRHSSPHGRTACIAQIFYQWL